MSFRLYKDNRLIHCTRTVCFSVTSVNVKGCLMRCNTVLLLLINTNFISIQILIKVNNGGDIQFNCGEYSSVSSLFI